MEAKYPLILVFHHNNLCLHLNCCHSSFLLLFMIDNILKIMESPTSSAHSYFPSCCQSSYYLKPVVHLVDLNPYRATVTSSCSSLSSSTILLSVLTAHLRPLTFFPVTSFCYRPSLSWKPLRHLLRIVFCHLSVWCGVLVALGLGNLRLYIGSYKNLFWQNINAQDSAPYQWWSEARVAGTDE